MESARDMTGMVRNSQSYASNAKFRATTFVQDSAMLNGLNSTRTGRRGNSISRGVLMATANWKMLDCSSSEG